jgi:hypothetical protein
MAAMDSLAADVDRQAKEDTQGLHERLMSLPGAPSGDVKKALAAGVTLPHVYMMAHIAILSGMPFAAVEADYRKSRGKGWGVVAQNMGIKPGSKEFHALKQNLKGGTSKGKDHDSVSGSTQIHEQGQGKGSGKGHGKNKGR